MVRVCYIRSKRGKLEWTSLKERNGMKQGMKQLSATCIRTEKQQLSKIKFETEPLYCRAYLKWNVLHLVAILCHLGGNMSITIYKDFTYTQSCIDPEYLIAIILAHFQSLVKILENKKSD